MDHFQKTNPGSKIWDLVAASAVGLAHGFATLLMVEFLAGVVSGYRQYFEQNETELPMVTVHYLSMAGTSKGVLVLALLVFVLLDIGILYCLRRLPEQWRWVSGCWSIGYLLLALLYLYWGSVAMGTPFIAA